MTYENHINKFIDAAAIQAAIDNGDLLKPYVALDASAGTIDFNTRSVTPPSPSPSESGSGSGSESGSGSGSESGSGMEDPHMEEPD